MQSRRSEWLLVAVSSLIGCLVGCGGPTRNLLDTGIDADAGPADVTSFDTTGEVGARCTTDMQCDDGTFCNGAEHCLGGTCVAGIAPCDDHASCTDDHCDETMRICTHVPHDEMCGDMNACDGTERCAPGTPGVLANGCQAVHADNLIDCDDGNICTIDTCDIAVGCVHSPRDLDGDGFVDRMCTYDATPTGMRGDDCDDSDPTVYPGAPEVCDDNRDNNCNGLVDYADTHFCMPHNDSCTNARMLPGPGTYWASTLGLANHFALSCNTAMNADAVFTFTLTAPHDVHISMTSTVSGTALALGSPCDPSFAEIACNPAIDGGPFGMSVAPSIFIRSLPAGTYAIIAETPDNNAFEVTLRVDPPTMPPPGDLCPPSSPAVDVTDGSPQTLMLGALDPTYTIACNSGMQTNSGVFRIHLDTPRIVNLTVTGGSGTTYASVRQGPCPSGPELRCLSDSSGAGIMTTFRNWAAGDYFVFVQNDGNANVTASITTSDPTMRTAGDACISAQNIALGSALPVSGNATVDFSTLLSGADYGTSCGSGSMPDGWRDAVYSFTIPANADTTVTVTPSGTWPSSPAYFMAIETMCGTQGSEIGHCANGVGASGASQMLVNLPAGTYYVVVETMALPATGAGFTVSVSGTDPAMRPAYETCPGANIPLTTSGSNLVGSVSVDETSPALLSSAQVGTACGSGSSPSGFTDVVFSFTTPDTRNVQFDFTGASLGMFTETEAMCGIHTSAVNEMLLSGSMASGTCLAFASSATAPTSWVASALPAGTYYVVLESVSRGAITLNITASP